MPTTIFPIGASDGDHKVIAGKRYVYDGTKWVLSPLLDEFYNEDLVAGRRPDPSVVTELPRVDGSGAVIEGTGRDYKHTFTIKDLEDLETI